MGDKELNSLWVVISRFKNKYSSVGSVDEIDAVYTPYKNAYDPYFRRHVANKEASTAAPDAYLPETRRPRAQPTPPSINRQGKYLNPDKMPGNSTKLPWQVYDFCQTIIKQLTDNPQSLKTVTTELVILLNENNITIPEYESYRNIKNWTQFMRLLNELSAYPSVEVFELFCSAIISYYRAVYQSNDQPNT